MSINRNLQNQILKLNKELNVFALFASYQTYKIISLYQSQIHRLI